jgi:chromosome segregation ATPase
MDGTDVDGSGRWALTDQLNRADRQREAAEQRADRAEQRAQVAEDGREGERTRSDHLRDRIELLLVQVAELKAAAVRAEHEARAAQIKAEAAAAAVEQRNGASRVGLWARLLTARAVTSDRAP